MNNAAAPAPPNRWDTPTKWFAWAVLLAFTALSSYMNGAYAVLTDSRVWFHAGIPAVVLVLGVFLELTFLSSAHRAAKRIVVTGLALSFAVVLVASYLAVLHVTVVWNPHAPVWVNAALAALPDVVMVLAATVVLSLRLVHRPADGVEQPDLHEERVTQPMEQVVTQPEPTHDAVLEQSMTHIEATREATQKRPTATREPVVKRPVSQSPPLVLTDDAAVVAQRITEETTISQPVEVIVKVLELATQAGMSQRKIADAMPKNDKVSSSTVGRIVTAAREMTTAPTCELIAV